MTFVVGDAQFGSEFTIDKIQSYSITSDSSPGLLSGLKFTVPANPSPFSGVIAGTGSITNPYGKRGLPSVAWSIDQTNWYPPGGQIIYYNSTNQEYFTQIAVYVTTTDSTIDFVAFTAYTSSQTVYIQFAVDNPI